mgnify:CR=1
MNSSADVQWLNCTETPRLQLCSTWIVELCCNRDTRGSDSKMRLVAEVVVTAFDGQR